MMRFGSFALAAALFALACGGSAPPVAQVPAASSAPTSSVAPAVSTLGQPISLPNGGAGWLQTPTAPGKHGALLLVHEWWGVTDWIKQNVARFAARGYVALAVDLYRGRVPKDAAEAHELSRGLSEDRAMDDMKAAFRWVAARPEVDPLRIGIVGWCMGGGYALAFAVAEPQLRAAVVNYGKLVTAPEKIDALNAALLGNFAGADRGIAPDDVRVFADELRAAHKDADIRIFDGAKHSFMNPNHKDSYDEVSAKDAWKRIDAFLARTLGG